MKCFIVKNRAEYDWLMKRLYGLGCRWIDPTDAKRFEDRLEKPTNDLFYIETTDHVIKYGNIKKSKKMVSDFIFVSCLNDFINSQKQSEKQEENQGESKSSEELILQIKTTKDFETELSIDKCTTSVLATVLSDVIFTIVDDIYEDFDVQLINCMATKKIERMINGKV